MAEEDIAVESEDEMCTGTSKRTSHAQQADGYKAPYRRSQLTARSAGEDAKNVDNYRRCRRSPTRRGRSWANGEIRTDVDELHLFGTVSEEVRLVTSPHTTTGSSGKGL